MIYLLLVCVLFLIDFRIKTQIEVMPEEQFPVRLLHGHIEVLRLHNQGLAGSLLQDKPRLATLIAGAAFSGFLFFVFPHSLRKGSFTEKLSISLITGGACGNFFDRIGRGYVVDYLSFPKAKLKKIRHFVYNLADLFLFAGSALLLIRELFRKS